MNRRIKLSPNQLNEIKVLYETTLITIKDLAQKYNVSWNYISSILKENNITKPKHLQKQVLSKANKKHQQSKTPEQRRQIALDRWSNISKEDKENRYNKVSKTSKITWSNKTQEELNLINSKISTTQKQKWDNKTEQEKEQHKKHIKEYWTLERKEIHSKKISSIYSNKSKQEKIILKRKISKTSTRMWSNMTQEQKDIRNNKLSNSIKNVWKNRTQEDKKLIYSKIFNTMKQNKRFTKSSLEEFLYNKFINNSFNIEWQYKENNYWYDFKITYNNQVTLLELNGTYWHNKRPFIECKEHIQEYNNMYNIGGQKRSIAIKWRYTDVNKYNYCKQNNINFIRIYFNKTDYNDIYNVIINNLNKGIKTFIL